MAAYYTAFTKDYTVFYPYMQSLRIDAVCQVSFFLHSSVFLLFSFNEVQIH